MEIRPEILTSFCLRPTHRDTLVDGIKNSDLAKQK